MSDNFLYIIGNRDQNIYKVGISNNPLSRIKGIQTGCPFPLTIIKKYNLNSHSSNIEKKIHNFLEQDKSVKSMVGEWFSCDVRMIDSLVQSEMVDIQKEEAVKKQKEKEQIEAEKIALTRQKEELELAMIPLFELQKNLDEKFAILRKTESDIIKMTEHFNECRKKLNKQHNNKELKEHYREIINKCLINIRHLISSTNNPLDYGSYYDRILSLFNVFSKKKMVGLIKRSYKSVETNDKIKFDDGIVRNANFLEKKYLDLSKYDQFALVCKTRKYLNWDVVHFEKDSEYYLIEELRVSYGSWDRDFHISTDSLFGNHENKGTYSKFLEYLKEHKGSLSIY
jgi:hypothetical protein